MIDQGTFAEGMFLYNRTARIINNLQGIRYQTRQYGPIRFYGKAGAGVAWFNLYGGAEGGSKFSAGYGGGTNIWFHKNIGVTLDVSHVVMNLPKLTELEGRKRFDSGMTYTAGITFRF
jgi:hypothetical protein